MVVNDTTFKKSLYLCIKFLEKLNDRLIVTSLPSIFFGGKWKVSGDCEITGGFFLCPKIITGLHTNAIKLKKKKDF